MIFHGPDAYITPKWYVENVRADLELRRRAHAGEREALTELSGLRKQSSGVGQESRREGDRSLGVLVA